MAEVEGDYRCVRVFDAAGTQLSPTTERRADELIEKGRAVAIADEGGAPAIRLSSVAVEQASPQPAKSPRAGKRRRRLVAQLRERDGDSCFFCLRIMEREQMTVEHLLARHEGGSDSKANLVLAHKLCNEAVGHLALIEKIKIRERNLLFRVSLCAKEKA